MPYVGLLMLVLWVVCLVDVITAEEYAVRHLPKWGWLVVVILLPLIGSVLWVVVGRPAGAGIGGTAASPRRGRSPVDRAFPEYNVPGRAVARDPAADEEFLRQCRERAEAQRRALREQVLRDEVLRNEDDNGAG